MEATVTWKAYLDLTRAHFSIVWPLLICAGLSLATTSHGTASAHYYLHVGTIGLFGFLAGLVQNDIVDRTIDEDEPDESLTRYWRPFKERPLVTGSISLRAALVLFLCLVIATTCLVVLLPYPHNVYILAIMGYAYAAEYFYQTKKRRQSLPVAQLVGRTDLALFPVAGYLAIGGPDITAAYLFFFMYTWALVHLALNDLADMDNDMKKRMYTIPVLYGANGNIRWIIGFAALHAVGLVLLVGHRSTNVIMGGICAFLFLSVAVCYVMRRKDAIGGIRALPFAHMSLLTYALTFLIGTVL